MLARRVPEPPLTSSPSPTKVIAVPVTATLDYYTEKFAKHHADTKPLMPINTFRNMAVDLARTNTIFTVGAAPGLGLPRDGTAGCRPLCF